MVGVVDSPSFRVVLIWGARELCGLRRCYGTCGAGSTSVHEICSSSRKSARARAPPVNVIVLISGVRIGWLLGLSGSGQIGLSPRSSCLDTSFAENVQVSILVSGRRFAHFCEAGVVCTLRLPDDLAFVFSWGVHCRLADDKHASEYTSTAMCYSDSVSRYDQSK
jgi:hypothetical protein